MKHKDKKNKIVEVQHIVDKDVQSAKEINIKFIKTYNSLMDEITAKFNHLNLKDINLTYEDLETGYKYLSSIFYLILEC